MSVLIMQGDARNLPLPDESVDLIVTSPPYFALRSYTDGGEHYAGQIGAEATPQEYIASLTDCTREWIRVLKPSGSLFVNLGDKYSQRVALRPSSHQDGLFRPELAKDWKRDRAAGLARMPYENVIDGSGRYVPEKSLMGLPWRYALACVDELGLILRAEIVWAKLNGLPESVTDRVRRAHEQVFHFTKQPRYYSAVDEIREGVVTADRKGLRTSYPPGSASGSVDGNGKHHHREGSAGLPLHPLGKLPGSVWSIPSQPLAVPPELGIDHFAAFPMELPRRIIAGWSPSAVCQRCGQGRRPVTASQRIPLRPGDVPGRAALNGERAHGSDRRAGTHFLSLNRITNYACACTPFTDHPERRQPTVTPNRELRQDQEARVAAGLPRHHGNDFPAREPVREYHWDQWKPPPALPAVVLDPFGGTGATALVANALGRTGITVDLSADYCRLARWRTSDPGERARALGVPKPPPVPPDQLDLFDFEDAV